MQTEYKFKDFKLVIDRDGQVQTNGYLVYRVAHGGRESSRHYTNFAELLMGAESVVRKMLETQEPREVYGRFRGTEYDVEVDHGEAYMTVHVSDAATRYDLECLLGYDHRMTYLVGPDNVACLLREYRQAVFEYGQGTRSMTDAVLRPSGHRYSKSQHLDLCGMSNLMHALVRAGMIEVVQ